MTDPYVILDTGLTHTMVGEIYHSMQELNIKLEDALIDDNQNNPTIRKAYQAGIHSQQWYAGAIWYNISRVNAYNYHYDIEHYEDDQINFIRYNTTHHYDWHTDDISTPPHSRKLSFSLLLNDDYTGGDLQLDTNNGIVTIPKKKGLLVIFDSRIKHRVTPVESNHRDVLVGWAVGPLWR